MSAGTVVVDVALSREVAKAFNTRSKACYRNCWRVMECTFEWNKAHWMTRLGSALMDALRDLRYVEGFAAPPGGLAFDHAWLEGRGAVIDPTLVLRPAPALRHLLGDAPGDPSDVLYAGAHRLTGAEAAGLLRKRKTMPLTFEGNEPDLSDPLWRAAYEMCPAAGKPIARDSKG